jgi:hypothetical protein
MLVAMAWVLLESAELAGLMALLAPLCRPVFTYSSCEWYCWIHWLRSQSYFMTYGRSVTILVSSPLCNLWLDITSCWNIAVFFLWVCSLQCNHTMVTITILYCLIWDFPQLEGQVPVFISPRNRVAPTQRVPFTSPLTTHRATVEVF